MNRSSFSSERLTSQADISLASFRSTKKQNINMSRGSYSRVVKNKNPTYEVPENHTKRLAFINELVGLSQTRDVTTSDVAMYSRAIGERKKRLYSDGANAMRVLYTVFCEHVNLVTHQVEISLRNASDAAGLSTTSASEQDKATEDKDYTPVVSISRASRAFKKMILLGWIVAPEHWQVWDSERGYWIDKYFEVTPLFFEALGITPERVIKQQTNRLKYLQSRAVKEGITPEEAGRLSITQIKAERKLAWRRNAFDRRSKEQDRKKTHRKLKERSLSGQRSVAQVNVINALGRDIHGISTTDFKEMVNKEIATLRKFTDLKPPLN